MTEITLTDCIAKLKQHRIKATPQRLAICEEVLGRKDHPTAEELHKSLESRYPTLSVATIYKTLQILKRMRLIQEVESTEGGIRYDPNTNLHLNVICVQCGVITDITTESLSEMWAAVTKEAGIHPHGQVLNAFYVCEKCRKK